MSKMSNNVNLFNRFMCTLMVKTIRPLEWDIVLNVLIRPISEPV